MIIQKLSAFKNSKVKTLHTANFYYFKAKYKS